MSEKFHKAEMRAKQDAAARQPHALFKTAKSADPARGYLVAKMLAPFGIRQEGAALLVPMFNPAFRIWNLQRIATARRERGKRCSLPAFMRSAGTV